MATTQKSGQDSLSSGSRGEIERLLEDFENSNPDGFRWDFLNSSGSAVVGNTEHLKDYVSAVYARNMVDVAENVGEESYDGFSINFYDPWSQRQRTVVATPIHGDIDQYVFDGIVSDYRGLND